MRIGILTHELKYNYGGILQNYALQQVLKKLGHEPVTIDYKQEIGLTTKIKSLAKRFIARYIFRKNIKVKGWPSAEESNIIQQYTRRFVKKYITTTDRIKLSELAKFKDNFDAIIVGSDQVWRPRYFGKQIYEMFLKSFPDTIPKIAYAASFGVDYWEFTGKQTAICRKLAQHFKAISVREASGIGLCKTHLNADAVHVLDPTMLLDKDDYIKLVKQEKTPSPGKGIITYVLDKSPEKDAIIQAVGKRLGLPTFSVMPKSTFAKSDCIDDCTFPPVTSWLRGFMDADFVVTDSFHGTVFSIIFNKPFITTGNKTRGNSRFDSLLKMFNLHGRLITSTETIYKIIDTPIDWNTINTMIGSYRQKAINYLSNNLN